MTSSRLQCVSLSLCLLSLGCGGPKSSSEKPARAAPAPEAGELPITATIEVPQGEHLYTLPEGLTYSGAKCVGLGAEYFFTKMLYKGSVCDIRLRATSPETDLNDWESAGLSVSGENANSPLTGRFFNSLNMTVDSDQQSLVLKAYLLGNKFSSSAVELGLRKKSTGQIYFLTLSPAQKEDLYERFDIVQSSAMVLMSTDDKGHRQQLKALVRRDSAGVPVLRANEMLAFDYDVTGRPDMLFTGVPSGGTVRLAAPYEGLGSFFNHLDRPDNAPIGESIVGPSLDLKQHVAWQLYVGGWDLSSQLSPYRRARDTSEPVTYRGLVEGVYTSQDASGLELASAPFKFRLVDASLANDLEIQVSSSPAGQLESVRVKNVSDYDLRPLGLQYVIQCDGNKSHLAGRVFLDPVGVSKNAQTTRMLPGDVWEIAANDIVQDYKLQAKEWEERNQQVLDACRDPHVSLKIWEYDYLSGSMQGDVVDVLSGKSLRLADLPRP